MPEVTTWYEQPGARERSLWRKARREFNDLSVNVALMRLRIELLLVAVNHAMKYGVQITASNTSWLNSRVDAMQKLYAIAEKLGMTMDAAERGSLFIRPKADGSDLDIVSATYYSEEELARYVPQANDYPPDPGAFGIAPLLLLGIIAAVVIGGIITVTATSETLANRWQHDIEVAQIEAEKKFCEDPKSEVCKTWLAKMKERPNKKARSAIDYLLGEGAGMKVAGGLALAIAAGVAYWFWTHPGPRRAA